MLTYFLFCFMHVPIFFFSSHVSYLKSLHICDYSFTITYPHSPFLCFHITSFLQVYTYPFLQCLTLNFLHVCYCSFTLICPHSPYMCLRFTASFLTRIPNLLFFCSCFVRQVVYMFTITHLISFSLFTIHACSYRLSAIAPRGSKRCIKRRRL